MANIAIAGREGLVRGKRHGEERGYSALRQRAIATARHGLDVGLFADRLSQVLHREVPAHVVSDVEAGRPVDWKAIGFDALDLMLAAAEVTGRPLSELFEDQHWHDLVQDVDRLYGSLVMSAAAGPAPG